MSQVERVLFRETTTLGIRRWRCERRTLDRRPHQVITAWGEVAGVLADSPEGQTFFSPEFDSCRRLAMEQDLPLRTVYEAARQAFRQDER